MADRSAMRALMRELAESNKLAKAQNLAQLGNSSIENGAIDEYDADGNLTSRLGTQHDGTHAAVTLAGPPPPTPAGFTCTGGQLDATAVWDGTWADDAVAPMDFARIEVHASTSGPDFTIDPMPMSATRVGTIETAAGASLTFSAFAGQLWVKLTARAQSGKVSDQPTAAVEVEVSAAVDPAVLDQLQEDLATAQQHIDDAQAELDAAAALLKQGEIVDRVNLATNPNFTTNVTGYNAGGGAGLTRDTSAILDPTGCMKVTGGTSTDSRADFPQSGNKVTMLQAGKTYTISADAILGAAFTGSLNARAKTIWVTMIAPSLAGGVQQEYMSAPATTTKQRLSLTFTIPADATQWLVRLYNGSNTVANAIYWDKILVEEAGTARPYFDGSTPTDPAVDGDSYRWTGTANASTSQAYRTSAAMTGPVDGARVIPGTIVANKLVIQDVTAAVGAIIKLDVSQLTVTGTSNFAAAVVDKMFANIFAAHKVTADEIDAEAIAAAVGTFVKVNAENVLTGDLTATISITTGKVIAGNVEIGDGIQTFATDLDGNRKPATSLGVPGSPDALEISPQDDGSSAASVTPDGIFSGTSFASDGDVSVGGSPLVGKLLDPAAPAGILDQFPRGVVAPPYNFRNLTTTMSGTTGQNAYGSIGQIDYQFTGGRNYRIMMPWRVLPSKVSGSTVTELVAACRMFYTFTTDGSEPATPTTSSPVLASGDLRTPATRATGAGGILLVPSLPLLADTRVKILVAVYADTGTQVTPNTYTLLDWIATIEDIGPAIAPADAALPGNKSVQQFTTVWTATDSRSWGPNGAIVNAANSAYILHGVSPTAGLLHSAFVCNGAATSGSELGKTMATALAGATILKVRVGLQSVSWEDNKGQLTLQKFTGTTLATTDNKANGSGAITQDYTANSQWKWTTDPSMTSWISATNRGIYLGPPGWQGSSTHASFASAYFATTSIRPQIEVTYTRAAS